MRFIIFIVLFIISITPGFSQNDIQINEPDEIKLSVNERDSVIIIQDSRTKALLKKHISYNENIKGTSGYRIQIYSGSGGATKNKAVSVRTKFLKIYPDITIEIIYKEPDFKVRVGLYRTKSDGYKMFKELQKFFPGSYFVIENEMDYPPL